MNNQELQALIQILQSEAIDSKLTVATAESCTGGMIGEYITSKAGSSGYYQGGIISYSNAIKMRLLQVSAQTLDIYGAVSYQTAKEMAEGCRCLLNVDLAVATTGIAGPDGGSKPKPVGLVYIAISTAHSTEVQKHIFEGTRIEVQKQASQMAISGLLRGIRLVV